MSELQEKRHRILAAALDLFSELGFHATSVPQVAEQARVALGTIYRYFPSKEALVNEVYCVEKERLAKYLLARADFHGPPREQFQHLWDQAVAFALEHPKAVRFLELHHHASYLDDKSREMENALFDPALHLVQRAIDLQVVKPLSPYLLLSIVWGAFLGVIRGIWEQRISPDPDTLRDAEQCCWEAIRR